MYKVTFGGKKGKTVSLVESPDLVAIRTKGNKELESVSLSREARDAVKDTVEVAAFPDSGITVRRVHLEAPPDIALESVRGGAPAPPPDPTPEDMTHQRDATRAILKQEEEIRFAGRVLQDADSGEVMLYTENFFIKFLDKVSEAECEEVIKKYNLIVRNKLVFAKNAYFVSASEGTGLQVFNIAEEILKEKQVEYCHPELVQERRFKEIHPLQWHLFKTTIAGQTIDQHVNIETAWRTTRGKGMTVAVIDDGVDIDHPEFAGRVVHPFDATGNSANPRPTTDDDNHGTACAGLACAAGLNNGASGTAPEAFLMPIRLRSGLGSMAEANAFVWAADHGADVISCSWGPTDGEWWNPGDAVHNRQTMLPDSTRLAMEYALTKGRSGKGSVILFAAGNGNEDTKNDGYASFPGVIAVAACNDSGKRSVYSDFGDAVWVSFPSGDFGWKAFRHPAPVSEGLRTIDRLSKIGYSSDNYTNNFGGTSGACPGMAGVVALMLSVNPALTPKQVKDVIRQSTVRIDETEGEYNAKGHSIWYGYGRIDAAKAVENAKKMAQSKPATKGRGGLEGRIKFSGRSEKALKAGAMNGSETSPRKVSGFSLRLKPAIEGLSLRYKINVANAGMVESKSEGEFVGVDSARQSIIGFSIALEGPAAAKYEIEYTARFKDVDGEASGKNGSFCGSDKKTGKPLEDIAISFRKK